MNKKDKPPFPGIATKPSVIPAMTDKEVMIEVLKKHNLPFTHLLMPYEKRLSQKDEHNRRRF